MPRIPLAANLGSRDATLEKDALLKNCFVEKTDNGLAVVKRPGETLSASLGAGCAQGAITFDGQALWLQADTLHTSGAGIPALSSFTSVTTPPKPTNGSSVGTARGGYLVSHLGDLYSIGGRNNGDTQISVYKSTDHGANWSTIATPWTTTIIGGGDISSTQAVSYGGKIYALGIVGARNIQSSTDGVTWTQETSDLAGGGTRNGTALIVHNSLLYAFLGLSSANVQIWSSSNGSSWTSVNSGISSLGNRYGFCVFSLNGRLYLAGGIDGSSVVYDDVWVSTDNGSNWVRLASSAGFGVRFGASSWVSNSRLWIGGGFPVSDTAAVNNVWSSEDGSAWIQATSAAGWSARGAAGSCIHNSRLYIGPGYVNGAIVSGLYWATSTVSSSFTLSPAPATSCQRFQMTLIPATATTSVCVFIKSNEVAYYYNGLSVVRVTDGDYPPSTVYGVVYLDGTVYVMDSKGIIYGSDLSAPTSWSALNFISANAEADGGVALVRQLNYVVALKEYSIEMFYDAGNATGSPLSKVTNSLLEIGCASADSIAFTENTFYFMANSRQKGRSIVRMNGATTEPISTPAIERILNDDDLATVYAFIVKIEGHLFYVITLGTSDVTLVFDASTGIWCEWTTLTAQNSSSVTSLVVQSDGTILATMGSAHGKSDGDPVTIAGASQAGCNGRFNISYDTSVHSTSQFSYNPSATVSGSITGTITAVFYTEASFGGAFYAQGSGTDLILDKSTGKVYEFDPEVYDDNDIPINVEIRTSPIDGETIANKTISRLAVIGDRDDTNIVVNWSDDDYQTWSVGELINIDSERPEIRRTGRFRRRAMKLRHVEDSRLRLVGLEPIVKTR